MIDANVVLLQWFKSFDKKLSDSGVKSEIISNQQFAEEPHKPIIKKFEEQKPCSCFKKNIWGANMQLLSKFINGFHLLLCAIDVYTRYARLIPLKDKKGITIKSFSRNIRWVQT